MPIESGSFIGDLNPSYPLGTDPRAQGDDHLRLIKTALRSTFPNLSGRFGRVQVKTAAYSLHPTDNTSAIVCTAAFTVTVPAPPLFAGAFTSTVIARGGDVTLQATFSNTINGSSTLVVKNGEAAVLYVENGAWYALVTRYPPTASLTEAGVLQLATENDSRAWVANNRMLTPLSFTHAFGSTRRSPTAQGFQQFPAGLVLQWGNTGFVTSEGTYNHNFPRTFANFCLQVVLGGYISAPASSHDMWPQLVSMSNSGFTWQAQSQVGSFQPAGATYLAIGFD